MATSDTKKAVAEEAKRLVARTDRGRAALTQMGMLFPGGDICPSMVVRGLQKLLAALASFEAMTPGVEWDTEERAALQWLRAWVDAGAALLPRGER